MPSSYLRRSRSFCLGAVPNKRMGWRLEMTKYKRIALATLTLMALTGSIAAQTPDDPQKARPRTTTTSSQEKEKNQPVEPGKVNPDDTKRAPVYVADDSQAKS